MKSHQTSRQALVAWAAVLLMPLCALAQPALSGRDVLTFHTEPDGLYVWVEMNLAAKPSYLGRSGDPIDLTDRSYAEGPRAVHFSTREDGPFLPWTDTVELKPAIQATHWPAGGPRTVPVPWLDWVRLRLERHPVATLLPPGLSVLTALALWSIAVYLRRISRKPAHAHLPGYTLGRVIGSGGMGEVFLAHPPGQPERLLAVKIMKASLSGNEEATARFEREVRICKDLAGKGFVPIYDWGETPDGRPFLVMEYLEGETLKDRLAGEGQLPAADCIRILEPLGHTLQTLHDRGLTHRDIKPDNIFLERTGRVLLMDFGAATGAELTALTVDGGTLGTPSYMAPEQIRGQTVQASDQYALGVVSFQMLTGRRPFRGDELSVTLRAHLEELPPDPRTLRTDLSGAAAEVVLRMLEKTPAARFSWISEATDALVAALRPGNLSDDTVRS